MEIVWKNSKIKKQIEKRARSNPVCQKRLNQIEKAPCYLDIPSSADAHFLKGDLENLFAVDFGFPARIICQPVGDYEVKDGKFVKETIMSIEIIGFKKDYHSKK